MRTKLPAVLTGLTVVIGMMIAVPIMAEMSSANYRIPNDVISGGGSAMSSANYQLVGTIGQSSPLGTASAASYTNYPGFWQADECVYDGDADGLFNANEYGLGTNAYDPDTDDDLLYDGEEVTSGLDGYTTDPLVFDTDSDNLGDGDEYTNGTIPKGANSSDTDRDGLGDGEEVYVGLDGFVTNPLRWDTDQDALPDKFESDNSVGHLVNKNLDPVVAEGATADFDLDGNPNVHEYWNGTDAWTSEPAGQPGCFYWGEGNGDGYSGPPDNAALTLSMKGGNTDYSNVLPSTGETQDLNADTYFGPPDLALLSQFMKGQFIGSIPTRPSSIERLSPATASVDVGNTTHLTVGLYNGSILYTPGFGVVFSVDPTSTGAATILGGDGADLDEHRLDVSGTNALSELPTIVIRVDAPGEIKINAATPKCGDVLNMGRYCEPLTMSAPFVIAGHTVP